MSVVSYNGITLPMANITSFRQDVIYDDSATDWYCTRFDIQTQCLVNANYLAMIAPNLVGLTDNPALIMDAIRTQLLHPRKSLSVKFNNVELIPQTQAGVSGTVDAQNGPKPQSFNYIQLTDVTFMCMYHIVAHYWENTNVNGIAISNQRGNNVLYCRWEDAAEVDNRNFTTRTRTGKFVIRSDNFSGLIPDQMRSQFAILGLLPKYLRRYSRYTQSPDGLGLAFQVQDYQVFKTPPPGAYEADGDYTESIPRAGGVRWGEARVRLKGPPINNQVDLIDMALMICNQKIRTRRNQLVKAGFEPALLIESASVRQGLYDNVVECSIRVMIATTKARVAATSALGAAALSVANGIAGFAIFQNFGVNVPNLFGIPGGGVPGSVSPLAGFVGMNTWTPLSENRATGLSFGVPAYGIRGMGPSVLLQAAAYFDPNLQAKINPAVGNGGQMDRGTGPGGIPLVPGQAGVNKET